MKKTKRLSTLSLALTVLTILSLMPSVGLPVASAASNVALNKTYTSSLAASASYPDTGGIELTDGLYGTSSYTNTRWQGRADVGSYYQTVDLGQNYSVTQIFTNFLQDTVAGIYWPDTVSFAYSTNGTSFTSLGNATPQTPSGSFKKYQWTGAAVTARYIRMTVTDLAGWVFEDEWEVWGNASATVFSHGSFIQPDITQKWTVTDWTTELNYLKEVGNTLIILQWTADSKFMTTIYPTALSGFTQDPLYTGDQVANLLTAADSVGLDVWLGLNVNEDWYIYHAANQSWLNTLFSYSQSIVTELWNNYHTHPSLKGFYFSNEMENCHYQDSTSISNLVANYAPLANLVHSHAGMKFSVAPALWPESWCGQTYAANSAAWQVTWDGILNGATIDYLLVQDGLGGAFHTNAEIVTWFTFIKTVINGHPTAHLWADVETFHVVNPNPWYAEPMVIKDVRDHLTQLNPIVENLVTFSYDHFQSPKLVNTALYHTTYKNYYTSGTVETSPPSTPTGLNSPKQGTDKILLAWTASTDDVGAMYYIYRNSVKIGKAYTTSYQDNGLLTPNTTCTYQVQAYDAAGNTSALSSSLNVTTAPSAIVLSATKPYTTSVAPSPSYPDTGGTELTDGVLGTMNYADPAWQGRNTVLPITYAYTLNLGSLRRVDGMMLNFYTDKTATIKTPKSVEFLISNDNVTFTSLGLSPYRNLNYGDLPADLSIVQYGLLTSTSTVAQYVKAIIVTQDHAWTFNAELKVEQYPVNLAKNKTYTASVAANASYPDTGGTELTNGVFGTTAYTHAAWQGRSGLTSYFFTINLGSAQSMSQFESTFLRDDGSGIALPMSVVYATSPDNVTFTNRGTVTTPSSSNLTVNPYRYVLASPVSAKYVKVTINTPTSWSFIDEAQVIK